MRTAPCTTHTRHAHTRETCAASSRVGAKTTARGRFGRALIPRASSSLLRRDTRGSRKASDFPEPVSAHSKTLSPASDTGSEACRVVERNLVRFLSIFHTNLHSALHLLYRSRCVDLHLREGAAQLRRKPHLARSWGRGAPRGTPVASCQCRRCKGART